MDTDRDDDEDDDTKSGCRALDALDDDTGKATRTAYAKADFARSAFGAQLEEEIVVQPGNLAQSLFSTFTSAISGCHQFTSKSEGTVYRGTISPISFPKSGDQTFAAQFGLTGLPLVGSATIDLIFVRDGATIISISETTFGGEPDPDEVAGIVAKSLRKAEAQVA